MPSTPVQITPSLNQFLNALQWGGWRWSDGTTPGTNITYYFAPGGIDLHAENPLFPAQTGISVSWSSSAQAAYQAAIQQWANVAAITFTQVSSYEQADVVEFLFNNSSTGLLGIHETPENAYNSDGTAWGGYNAAYFSSSSLQIGGSAFTTLVHEFGHALGLAHPHDDGGGSGLFPGVTEDDSSDTGAYDLNQNIFTIMSYNDGWETVLGASPSNGYGNASGPSAFDIAAIQYLYGANTSYHTGNDTYVLGAGDYMSCIWDAGGTDTIAYNGSYGCTINLNAATLVYGEGAGGFVSYIDLAPTSTSDHWSTFTIANGVVIENATGGSGSDIVYLSSMNVNNLINGNGGTDYVYVNYAFGSGYTIQSGSTASNLVMAGAAGADTFLNVEYVHFADGSTHTTASLIPVVQLPDLRVSSLILGSTTVVSGSNTTAQFTVSNSGAGSAQSSLAQIYLSTDALIDTSDIGLSAISIPYLVAGSSTSTGNYVLNFTGIAPGTYYVGAIVDTNSAVSESNESNNVSNVLTVTVVAPSNSDLLHDFTGDSTSDVLWYNTATRAVGMYEMHNNVATWRNVGTASAGWAIVSTGDYNGDGADDILWYNSTTRSVAMYEMHNGVATWRSVAGAATGWSVAGSGDFNGDGTDDILWYNASSRAVGMYEMHNGTPSWHSVGTGATGWSVAEIGDFDGDRTDDILWYNANTRAVGMYEMHDGTPVWRSLGTAAAGWAVAGTGDFNGDGTDDILWYNASTRSVGMYEMHSDGTRTWESVGRASTGWSIVSTGDYNGDGTDDILWYNPNTHSVGVYEMHDGTSTWHGIGSAAANWQILA